MYCFILFILFLISIENVILIIQSNKCNFLLEIQEIKIKCIARKSVYNTDYFIQKNKRDRKQV